MTPNDLTEVRCHWTAETLMSLSYVPCKLFWIWILYIIASFFQLCWNTLPCKEVNYGVDTFVLVMALGFSKDIRCHVWPYAFLCLQITSKEIGPQTWWAVSLVLAGCHFNLPQSFVWVLWVNILTLSPLRVWVDKEKNMGKDGEIVSSIP